MKKRIFYKVLTLILFACLKPVSLYAAKLTSVANGNWNSSGTWNPSRVPDDNDTVIVSAGNTVTVNINSPTYVHVVLKVYGTLFFNNGQKLNFDCTSIVQVFNTGKLDGGNAGSKIDMCGSSVWRGPGPDPGPFVYGFNPLPIQLLNFTVKNCVDDVCIDWTTISEINNAYFTVEKSKDGKAFELVAEVKAAGNSSNLKSYTYLDKEPYEGLSYYRLTQTDYSGASEIFSLREVNRSNSSNFSMRLYPNPGEQKEMKMSFEAEPGEKVLIVIYDSKGSEKFSQEIIAKQNGKNEISLETNVILTKGLYYITGTTAKKRQSLSLIIN